MNQQFQISSNRLHISSFHMEEEENTKNTAQVIQISNFNKKKSKSLPTQNKKKVNKLKSSYLTFSPQVNFLSTKLSRSSFLNDKESSETESSPLHEMFNQLSLDMKSYPYYDMHKRIENYWNDHHLKILTPSDPHFILKLVNSNVDLCTCSNMFYIGENGLDCSMRNFSKQYISIGRQQINEEFIRPNDIMLFPTDPSISRSHFKILHQNIFFERKKYFENVDLLVRASHSKNPRYKVPSQIWYMIIVYLKPRNTIDIFDNGTIYGTYVRIKEIDNISILMNLYILLKHLSLTSKVFFQYERLHSLFLNDLIIKSSYDNRGISAITPHLQTNQLIGTLSSYMRNCPIQDLLKNLENYLSEHYSSQFISPFSCQINELNSLFKDYNTILKEKQVYLTSAQSGFIVDYIGQLGKSISYINFNEIPNELPITIVSYEKIYPDQKLDPNSHMYSKTINSSDKIKEPEEEYLYYNTICLIETDGDPCGVMNRTQMIILVDSWEATLNPNTLSINCQKGFLLGKNIRRCVYSTLMDCDVFVFYSYSGKEWAIWDVTNITEEKKSESNEDKFGLWICTAEDKKLCNRFKNMSRGFQVRSGDQIRISETVLEVEYKF